MAKFEGNFEAFRYTPVADTATNTVVVVGNLIGVTRDNCAANDTIMAFMTAPKSVYSIPLTATAESAVDRGSLVKLSTGKIAAASDGDTAIGILWEGIAVGDKEALVAILEAPINIPAAASTT